jgi:hypothetical protein
MKKINVIETQVVLQNTTICIKKSRKKKQELELACEEVGLKP